MAAAVTAALVLMEKKQGLSGNAWKIIACVSMFIDHVGVVLIECGIMHTQETYDAVTAVLPWNWMAVDLVLRVIGRLAFPIYCFFLVEGFFHTKNVKKYGLRLALFAVISEVPFDMAVNGAPVYWGYQNVFFTLYFGLLAMVLAERMNKFWLKLLPGSVCILLAHFIHSDYGATGVLVIFVIYLVYVLEAERYPAGENFRLLPSIYSGERGSANLKWFFYVFYPAHLLLLVLIRYLLLGFWY